MESEPAVTYAYNSQTWPSASAFATYTAFLWPLTFALLIFVWPHLNGKWIIHVFEMLLCLGSGFMLIVLMSFRSPRYGAYIAGAALVIYFITALVELFKFVLIIWRRNT
jgi:hypothetical protein